LWTLIVIPNLSLEAQGFIRLLLEINSLRLPMRPANGPNRDG